MSYEVDSDPRCPQSSRYGDADAKILEDFNDIVYRDALHARPIIRKDATFLTAWMTRQLLATDDRSRVRSIDAPSHRIGWPSDRHAGRFERLRDVERRRIVADDEPRARDE